MHQSSSLFSTALGLLLVGGCVDKGSSDDTAVVDTAVVDADGDGYAADVDCDDADGAIHPDAAEVCDSIDNDCDALIDDADDSITGQGTWYTDSDADGYGDEGAAQAACEAPAGTIAAGGDCDDTDDSIHPGATEVCDPGNTDEDCSGAADDADAGVDPGTQVLRYPDSDSDGFGDEADSGTLYCDPPSGVVEDNTDCDDSTDAFFPGAEELCDGVDNDCNGEADNGTLGSSAACAAPTCMEISLEGSTTDGLYWLDPDEDGVDAMELYCDLTTDGGGWTLISWTGDSTSTLLGVPYPGLAVCTTQDCLRGSAATEDVLTPLIARSTYIGIGHSTSTLTSHQNLEDYEYSGYYDYGDLSSFYLDIGSGTTTGCDTTGLASGTFTVLSGPTTYDGTTVYVAQSFRYTAAGVYSDYSESSLYIWNIAADSYCGGSGTPPSVYLGNWSASEHEYGPYLSSTAGARAVWVR